MRYRKKPVVIDAIQWTGINVQEVMNWAAEMVLKFKKDSEPGKIVVEESTKINFDLTAKPHIKMTISTLNGDMAVDHGEFILCGVQGEIYPCKSDIFEATYDNVHPDYIEGNDDPFTFQTCKGCGHFLDSCECSWNFDHKKAKQMISEAELLSGTLTNKPKEVMRDLADLLEDSLRLDSERRTYYDSFKLVQEDRHKKMEEIRKLRAMLGEAVDIIDDCTDDPSKNQHTNAIEYMREEVKKLKG